MFGIGPMELMAILVVALLVFGPKRIPELARTMGRGLAEFRRASSELRQSLALDELERDLRHDPTRNQTIHRPSQAGDDLDPKSETDDGKHPGELPLGEDHDSAHHAAAENPSDESPDPEGTDMSADRAQPVDIKTDSGSDTRSNTDVDADAPKQTNQPADSELGNVPVSASKPADPRRG